MWEGDKALRPCGVLERLTSSSFREEETRWLQGVIVLGVPTLRGSGQSQPKQPISTRLWPSCLWEQKASQYIVPS